eukprot:jgi/Tetstr1/422559/TSEL_013367.t1
MERSVTAFDFPTVSSSGRFDSASSDQDSSCVFNSQPMDVEDQAPAQAFAGSQGKDATFLVQLRRAGVDKLNHMLEQGATQQEVAIAAKLLGQLRPVCHQTSRDLSFAWQ